MTIEQRVVARSQDAGGVVRRVQADKDSGSASGQPVRRDRSMLQRPPGRLQQQTLLRIHHCRLASGDPEHRGIEMADVLQEAAVSRRDAAGDGVIGAEQFIRIPPIRRHRTGRASPGGQHRPERVRVLTAGKPAVEANDRDRLAGDERGVIAQRIRCQSQPGGTPRAGRPLRCHLLRPDRRRRR